MPKPVTPQAMFDLWQKMVNPGAFPLQSLMFPVLDAGEIEKKIVELETVEHWLKANLNLLRLSIQSLEYQRSLLEGGEKAAAAMKGEGEAGASNPAMWAWNMMAQAGKSMADAAQNAARPAGESAAQSAAAPARTPKQKGSRKRSR